MTKGSTPQTGRLRHDAWRLDQACYPLVFDMRAAFGDMDSFRHLNNIALARMLEEGRVSLNIELAGPRPLVHPDGNLQLLMANLVVDYVNQGEYPGTLTVASAVTSIGRSSIHEAGGLFQGGRCIALAEAVIVHSVSGRPEPLPAEIRERVPRYLAKKRH